jgi:hypothetical protein
MRTVDRSPRTNYLSDTLLRLNRAKFWEHRLPMTPLILVDSGSPNPARYFAGIAEDRRVVVDLPGRRLTNNENALRALRLGLQATAEWILHLEDDIDVCDDIMVSIDAWLGDHAGPTGLIYPFYTFHAPYKGVRDAMNRGEASWEYPLSAFYGNQCWAIRRAAAASLADYLEATIPTWSSGQGFDLITKQWAQSLGYTHLLASAPSFVQHVGKESSLHLGRFHENASWPGREWSYRARRSA